MVAALATGFLTCAFSPALASPPGAYAQDTWVTYRDFRYVRCLDFGKRKAYFGTTKGILVYDLWRKKWDSPLTTSDGLPYPDIQEIREAEETNRVWVKTRRGVYAYHFTSERWETSPWDDPFQTPLPEREKPDLRNLHVRSPYSYDGNGILDAAHARHSITCAVGRKKTDLLIGTWGLGAAVGSARMKRVEIRPFGLVMEQTTAIQATPAGVWFGGWRQGGIACLDARTDQWAHFTAHTTRGLTDDHVLSMCASGDFLWVGTQYGVMRYSQKRKSWRGFIPMGAISGSPVRAILAQGDSLLWMGTNSALWRIRTASKESRAYPFPRRERIPVSCLLRAADSLWVGTTKGLYLLGPPHPSTRDRVLQRVRIDQPMVTNAEIHCLEKIDSTLWVGTERGLTVISTITGQALHAEATTVLRNRPIYAIENLQGLLALGTDDGLMVTDPGLQRIERFGKDDGLPHQTVYALQQREDALWLGTPAGATRCKWKSVAQHKGF